MSKKKVLILTPNYPLFAGDNYYGHFIHTMAKSLLDDFEVLALAPYKKGLARAEVMDGVKVFRHPQFLWSVDFAYGDGIVTGIKKKPLRIFVLPVFLLYQLFWVAKLCRTYRIDIVHTHWLIPAGLIGVTYKLLFNRKIKIISSALGSDYWGFRTGWGRSVLKFIFRHSDSLITVSNAIKKDIEENELCNKPIYPITMGIHTQVFVPAPSIAGATIKILYVGRLTHLKGIDLLIEVMPALLKKHSNLHLDVVGTGPAGDLLKQRVSDTGINDKVSFRGFVQTEDLPGYFANADIFVLPSLSEGWPVVVMEAMSAGCVPVVTDLPVFKEYAHRNDLFYIAKTGDQKSLEEMLLKAINSPDIEQVKANVRNYAIANFDWKIIVAKFKSVYNNTLAQTKN